MSILTVGTGEEYATIAAAVAAASDGDTIDVNAGTYAVGDLKITEDLTFAAVGGTVDIVPPGGATVPEEPPSEAAPVAPNTAAGNLQPPANVPEELSPTEAPGVAAASAAGVDIVPAAADVTKGLFIVGTDTSTPNVTIEGFSFSGAKASGSDNGAGIRYQSGNLTLDNDSFSNNQDGILATPFVSGTGTVDVNDCVFNHNGAGDGQSHNIYIGFINTFIMTNSISEDAVVGHEVKSRAENNTIEDNQIIDGPTGTASYSIDLPEGGNDIIQGNTIEKGPDASSPIAIHIGGPELPYVDSNIVIQDNTFINYDHHIAVAVDNEFISPVTVTDNTIENFNTILSGIGTQSGNVNASGGTIAASTNTTPSDNPSYTINLSNTSGNQTVTLTRPNQLVIGGSGLLTVIEDAGLETVYGGSGGVAVTGDGGETVYTKAGSTNTIESGAGGNTYFSFGNDTITVTGYNSIYDIYGTAEVNGGTAASDTETSYVSGTENFNMRGGDESFTIFPGGIANINGTGGANISENEATVNFHYDCPTKSTVFSGSFIGGEVVDSNGNMDIYEDTTRATIDLVQGTYDITDVAGSMISGGGATVDINEGGGNLTFIGGSGTAALNTGSGGATIFVGSGSLLVNEHAVDGPIMYNFNQAIGGGTVTIQDFRPSKDTLAYSGFTGDPIASQKVSAGSLYLTLQNHTSIVLLHETKL